MDDRGSLRLNPYANARAGQLGSLQRHKAYIRGIQNLDYPWVHSFLLNACLDILNDFIQWNSTDRLLDLSLKSSPDTNHDLLWIVTLLGSRIGRIIGLFFIDTVFAGGGSVPEDTPAT